MALADCDPVPIVKSAKGHQMLIQLGVLMMFQFIGEMVVTLSGIPFPGPLCGMALLLGYLYLRGGPAEELSQVGTMLLLIISVYCSCRLGPLWSPMQLCSLAMAWPSPPRSSSLRLRLSLSAAPLRQGARLRREWL